MTVTFCDISHYQTVDLAAYKAAGFDRVCMKATGGATDGTLRFADSTFAARWRQAGQLGLYRIAYHFARNNNNGADEYDWFISQVSAAGGMGPHDVLCYDQEDNRGSTNSDIGPNWRAARQRAREFVGRAVAQGHPTGWIYSGKWYLEPAGMVASDLSAGWRQLWISDYTAGQPDNQIEVPAGWTRDQIVARQYTDAATIPGISSTDADRVLHEWIEDDVTAAEVWAQPIPYPDYGADVPHAKPAYSAAEYLAGVSVTSGRLMQGQAAQTRALATLGAQQATLLDLVHQLTGGAVPIDYDRLKAAAEAGAEEALSHLRLVTDTPPAG